MFDKLTKGDIKKMEEEIDYRTLVVRPKALEDLKVARAQGDLSENFEYYAAKKYKNENEGRIRYLEKMIKTAIIVDDDLEEGKVSINNTVELRFENIGMVKKVKLVTTIRASALDGLISIDSPVGLAIRGKKVGDTAHVDMGNGNGFDVTILSIDASTDDSNDEIRQY